MRPLLLSLAAVLLLAPAAAEARKASFHTPSGNIRCLYRSADDGGGPVLRCDMLSLNDTAFMLDRRHRGKRVHVTDAVPVGRVLRYGATRTLGPFRCRSRITGLTCRSKPSGHGFRLSRARQSLF